MRKWIAAIACSLMALPLWIPAAHASSSKANPMEQYQVRFNVIDTNRDGALEWAEFEAHFKPADRTAFDALDTTGDGRIDRDEWHRFKAAHGMAGQKDGKGMGYHHMKGHGKAVPHGADMPDPAYYMKHMGDIDPNGDDALSPDEFAAAFPEGDSQKVFDAIDMDKDGSISHDEWHEFKAAHGDEGHN